MPSPFPGMDPYLEKHWGDVHARLIIYSCDQLQRKLPSGLRARVEERVFVESSLGMPRSIYPDVRVIEPRRRRREKGSNGAQAASVAEPVIIAVDEPAMETYLEVLDVASGGRVVTVVEFLSLSNKAGGEGQKKYLQKRSELWAGNVSLVEIDFLRGGDWLLAVPQSRLTAYRAAYHAVVRRGWRPVHLEYYPIGLQESLPTIKVPLREHDADATLNLQSLIEQCYENGGYDDIDYSAAPEPPLAPQEARWANRLLTQKGKRPRPKPTKK